MPQIVALVQKYFNFMLNYVSQRPYVPPTKYDEREWLSFRAIFLKVYRAHTVTIEGQRVPVVLLSANLTKAGASHMRITKTKTTVFVPSLAETEIAELPSSWQVKQVPRSNLLTLWVGPYAWWGWVDKHLALQSPEKQVRALAIGR